MATKTFNYGAYVAAKMASLTASARILAEQGDTWSEGIVSRIVKHAAASGGVSPKAHVSFAQRQELKAVFTTPQASKPQATGKSGKATGKASKATPPRHCKAANHSKNCTCGFGFPKSGKAPQATPQATPQASGKLDADTLKAIAEAAANAAVAAILKAV